MRTIFPMFMTRCNLQEGGNRNPPTPNITLHSYNNNQFSSRLKSSFRTSSVYVACAQKKREKRRWRYSSGVGSRRAWKKCKMKKWRLATVKRTISLVCKNAVHNEYNIRWLTQGLSWLIYVRYRFTLFSIQYQKTYSIVRNKRRPYVYWFWTFFQALKPY